MMTLAPNPKSAATTKGAVRLLSWNTRSARW